MSKKKRIALLLLGGNICTFYERKTDAVFPMTKLFPIESYFQEIKGEYELEIIDTLCVKNHFLETPDWENVFLFIKEKSHRYDGFVVLQETDSLLFGSGIISFLCSKFKKPIVFTSSIHPFLYPLDKSAENNIALALKVAQSDFGETVIVSHGKIIRAVRANRENILHSSGPFSSSHIDDIGKNEYNQFMPAIHRFRRDDESVEFPFEYPKRKVHFFRIFPGFPAECFENMLRMKDVEAVVVESLGYGSIRLDLLKILEDLAASGIHIIIIAEYDSVKRRFFLDADADIVRKKRMLLVKNMTIWATFAKVHIALQNESLYDFTKCMQKNLCGEIEDDL